MSSQTVLVAVTGLSPAILTETVWALAQEKPRLLPERVVCITTQVGAARLQSDLFEQRHDFGGLSPWQALRSALRAGDDQLIAEPPRVIGVADRRTGRLRPLADITTQAENDLAAEFILEAVRGWVENPDTRLVASIAGGRKTMGALLHAAISLIGRETDRLTHVLVSPPYESLPGFFFPRQPGGALIDRAGMSFPPREATIQLADVPFVPLRNRFREISEMPGTFGGLVRRFARQLKQDAAPPARLHFDHWGKRLLVDDVPVRLSPRCLVILHFVCACALSGKPLQDLSDAADRLPAWFSAQGDSLPVARVNARSIGVDDIVHDLSDVRVKLGRAGVAWTVPKKTLRPLPFELV